MDEAAGALRGDLAGGAGADRAGADAATAMLATTDAQASTAIAKINGWERRLERALAGFCSDQAYAAGSRAAARARGTFGVTELELFADCSSMWFVERVIDPRPIDARRRHGCGGRLRTRRSSGSSRACRTESAAITSMPSSSTRRSRSSVNACAKRWPVDEPARADRRRASRAGAGSPPRPRRVRTRRSALGLPLEPRRFEVLFGTERSAPELKAGLDLGGFAVSGKIDRIDLDPHSARGIVQDYKSGKGAHSAARIDSELKLQIPLYMLVLEICSVWSRLAGSIAPSPASAAPGVLGASVRDELLPGFSSRAISRTTRSGRSSTRPSAARRTLSVAFASATCSTTPRAEPAPRCASAAPSAG